MKLTVHALSRIFSGVFPTRALGLFHEDLMTARRRDPAATSSLEIALTYPGVHALWTHRVSHALWQFGAHTPARALSSVARAITAQVGNDVVIFHGVTLGGVAMTPGKRHPTVGDHVMIGAGAKVLGPITVGTGVKIGANAVVVKDVPCGNVAIGVPARLLPKPEKDTRDRDLIVDPSYFFEEPALYI